MRLVRYFDWRSVLGEVDLTARDLSYGGPVKHHWSQVRFSGVIASGRCAADAIAYTQTTCSTGAMPTPQSSAANTPDKPCSPTWQAFTPTQPHKPGNKN